MYVMPGIRISILYCINLKLDRVWLEKEVHFEILIKVNCMQHDLFFSLFSFCLQLPTYKGGVRTVLRTKSLSSHNRYSTTSSKQSLFNTCLPACLAI